MYDQTMNTNNASAPLRFVLPALFSQTRKTCDLSWRVVVGYLHVQRTAGVAEVFTNKHSALLTNEKGSAVSVTA